jgi:hypothetical protein
MTMNKFLIFIFTFALALFLTACQTNSFVNDPWKDPVVDPVVDQVVDQVVDPIVDPVVDQVVDQVVEPAEEPTEGSAEGPIDCTPVNGVTVECPEGMMCGTAVWISSEPRIRCLPNDICNAGMCANGEKCVIMETYPVQVACQLSEETIKPCGLEDTACDNPEETTGNE